MATPADSTASLRQELDERQREIDKLNRIVQKHKNDIRELQDDAAKNLAVIPDLEEDISNLKKQLRDEQAKLKRALDDNKALEKQISNHEKGTKGLQNTIAQQARKIDLLEEDGRDKDRVASYNSDALVRALDDAKNCQIELEITKRVRDALQIKVQEGKMVEEEATEALTDLSERYQELLLEVQELKEWSENESRDHEEALKAMLRPRAKEPRDDESTKTPTNKLKTLEEELNDLSESSEDGDIMEEKQTETEKEKEKEKDNEEEENSGDEIAKRKGKGKNEELERETWDDKNLEKLDEELFVRDPTDKRRFPEFIKFNYEFVRRLVNFHIGRQVPILERQIHWYAESRVMAFYMSGSEEEIYSVDDGKMKQWINIEDFGGGNKSRSGTSAGSSPNPTAKDKENENETVETNTGAEDTDTPFETMDYGLISRYLLSANGVEALKALVRINTATGNQAGSGAGADAGSASGIGGGTEGGAGDGAGAGAGAGARGVSGIGDGTGGRAQQQERLRPAIHNPLICMLAVIWDLIRLIVYWILFGMVWVLQKFFGGYRPLQSPLRREGVVGTAIRFPRPDIPSNLQVIFSFFTWGVFFGTLYVIGRVWSSKAPDDKLLPDLWKYPNEAAQQIVYQWRRNQYNDRILYATIWQTVNFVQELFWYIWSFLPADTLGNSAHYEHRSGFNWTHPE